MPGLAQCLGTFLVASNGLAGFMIYQCDAAMDPPNDAGQAPVFECIVDAAHQATLDTALTPYDLRRINIWHHIKEDYSLIPQNQRPRF